MVPVKSLAAAKSRLSNQLTAGDRAAVTLAMLRSVLDQLRLVPGVALWGVVSNDRQALALARELGAAAITEPGMGLNPALDRGRAWAVSAGAQALLVVPSDLPLARSADLAELLRLAEDEDASVVVAPSKDGGTNALLLVPPGAIPFRFGPGSAAKHLAEGELRGLRCALVHRGALAFDVDTPEDFSRYLALEDAAGRRRETQALGAR